MIKLPEKVIKLSQFEIESLRNSMKDAFRVRKITRCQRRQSKAIAAWYLLLTLPMQVMCRLIGVRNERFNKERT